MVSFSDLRRMQLFENLPESSLGRILPITQMRLFSEGAIIFEQGRMAEYFYLLLHGKVLLEVSASQEVNVSLGAVKPGFSFGWAALFPGSAYSTHAVCVEPCEVILVPGDRFIELLEKDPLMGYRVMKTVGNIFQKRLERRTGQFLKALAAHPEMGRLFSSQGFEGQGPDMEGSAANAQENPRY